MAMTPEQAAVWDLRQRELSTKDIAEELGITEQSVNGRIARAKRWAPVDPAIQESMDAVGTRLVPALAWAKTKSADGTSFSVLLKPEAIQAEPEDILARISDRLDAIKPAPFIKRVVTPSSDLRNFVPLFDVHLSMRIGNYGTAQAVERLQTGGRDILERMPAAECTIILNGGDFSHQNDPSNLTPRSQHPLPVDGEYDDVTDIATDVTAELIETGLQRSEHVIYQALRGNHDPNTARILRAALRQRYRNNPRVTIESASVHFFAHEWQRNFISGHHGDIRGGNAKDLVMGFAAKYPEEWGRTRFRELWTGHNHHLKAFDLPGMSTNQVRPICPLDRHAIENLYYSWSEMIGVTYRKGGGRHGSIQHVF